MCAKRIWIFILLTFVTRTNASDSYTTRSAIVSDLALSASSCNSEDEPDIVTEVDVCRDTFNHFFKDALHKPDDLGVYEVAYDPRAISQKIYSHVIGNYYKKEMQEASFTIIGSVVKIFGAMLLGFVSGRYILPQQDSHQAGTFATAAMTTLMQQFMSGDLWKNGQNLVVVAYKWLEQYLSENVEPMRVDGILDAKIAYFVLEFLHQQRSKDFPKELKIYTKDKLDQLHNALFIDWSKTIFGGLILTDQNGANQDFLMKIDELYLLLKIPTRSKPIVPEAKRNVEQLVATYPASIQKPLNILVSQLETKAKRLASKSKHSRNIYYFQGPPGTGKTRLAIEYAQAVGLPLLNVNTKKNPFAAGSRHSSNHEHQDQISAFLAALTSMPINESVDNAVIFFDEIDKILKNFSSENVETILLQLLDPQQSYYELPGPRPIKIDISRFTFIFTGNAPLSDELASRMTVLKFDGFNVEKRIKVGCSILAREYSRAFDSNETIQADPSFWRAWIQVIQHDQNQNIGLRPFEKTAQSFWNAMNDKNLNYRWQAKDLENKDYSAIKMLDGYSKKSWSAENEIYFLKSAFESIKPSLEQPRIHTIQETIDEFEKELLISHSQPDNDKEYRINAQKESLAVIKAMLRVPFKVKPLDEQVNQKFSARLGSYPDGIKSKLATSLAMYVSNAEEQDTASLTKKAPLYFYGEPGVGKSYLAKKLAKDAGVPIVEMNLNELSNGKGNLLPYEVRSLDSAPGENSLFTSVMLRNLDRKEDSSLPLNAFVLIDEADKILNVKDKSQELRMQLLKLIDPDTQFLELKELKDIRLDLRRFLFILVGNEKIENAEALHDRMETLHFSGFSKEHKKSIVRDYFKRRIAKKLNLRDDNTENVLGTIVDADDEAQSLSLRPLLRCVEKYVSFLSRKTDEAFEAPSLCYSNGPKKLQ
jgi:ATP-dependent Lon protease